MLAAVQTYCYGDVRFGYGHRPVCQIVLDTMFKRGTGCSLLYPACDASRSLRALMEFARNVLISVTLF
jgi:hypothetical protein